MNQQKMIEINQFSYVYEGFENFALKNVSLCVNKGDFIGIVGCNKAGKSTLCLSIFGILPYALGGSYHGNIVTAGEDLEKTKGENVVSRVGIVFQDAESQFTQETVEDEIAFAMCNMGVEPSEMVKRVEQAASVCRLSDMLDRSPFKLSGGQQQRLAIACILALNPEIIILDEATSQLDPIGRDEVFALVRKLHKAGHTVIMVDHNIEKIAEYAEKIAVLHEGELVMFGEKHEIFAQQERLLNYNIRVPQVSAAAIGMREVFEFAEIPINLQEAITHFASLKKEVE